MDDWLSARQGLFVGVLANGQRQMPPFVMAA